MKCAHWIAAVSLVGAVFAGAQQVAPRADLPFVQLTGAGLPERLQVRSTAYSRRAQQSLREGSDRAEPQRGGTIHIWYPLPGTLNNILRRTGPEIKLCREYLFPPLLVIDPDSLSVIPELAASRPVVSDDQMTYRWTLRRGVHWHRGAADGTPVEVTTRDVQFSWDMTWSDQVDAGTARAGLKRFEQLKVLDDYQFEVTLKEPYFRAELEFGNEFRLMPAHLAEQNPAKFGQDPLGRAPVGYGPYELEEWVEGSHVTLRRRWDYWEKTRRPYYIERIRFLYVREPLQQMAMLKRGEIDILPVQDSLEFELGRDDPQLQQQATFHEYYLPRWTYIGWNNEHWAFSDPRVRRAMTMLFPRELVRDEFYRGHAAVQSGCYPVTALEYDHDLAPLPFDPAGARKLLAEAGFRDTDGDRILDRDGRKLEFTLLRPTAVVPQMESGNELFRAELEKVGVRMQVRRLDFNSAFLPAVRAHEFDACQLGWSSDPIDDDLYSMFHSTMHDGASNHSLYADEATDRLLEAYRDEYDAQRRHEIGRELHRRIHTNQPFTFLFTLQSTVLVSTRFRDVRITRLGAKFTDWWIPGE